MEEDFVKVYWFVFLQTEIAKNRSIGWLPETNKQTNIIRKVDFRCLTGSREHPYVWLINIGLNFHLETTQQVQPVLECTAVKQ